MPKDFSDLPSDLWRFSKSLLGAVEQAVESIAEAGVTAFINTTPVDTTNLVSNWTVTQGAPFTGLRSPVAPDSVKGSGANVARDVTKQRALAAIKGYSLSTPMYISNNVVYFGPVNDGDAKHRPANMVNKGRQSMSIRAKQISLIKLAGKNGSD
jgi:hypothetical protein